MSQKPLSRNKNGMLAYMKLYKKKGSEKKNPGFEFENQIQSSCTGCQSDICV